MGDGLGLAALFGLDARISSVGIHERENRPFEFLGNLHGAQRFAIALGMRSPKVTIDALLHVAAFLRADDKNFFAMKTCHAADDGRIVAKAAVAVDLAPVGED